MFVGFNADDRQTAAPCTVERATEEDEEEAVQSAYVLTCEQQQQQQQHYRRIGRSRVQSIPACIHPPMSPGGGGRTRRGGLAGRGGEGRVSEADCRLLAALYCWTQAASLQHCRWESTECRERWKEKRASLYAIYRSQCMYLSPSCQPNVFAGKYRWSMASITVTLLKHIVLCQI